jgi:hypothetical protein
MSRWVYFTIETTLKTSQKARFLGYNPAMLKLTVFLEVADGAFSILTGKDGLLYPSAQGEVRDGETPQETAARL